MNKLQSVLNDEESMKQVRELADMLSQSSENGGGSGGTAQLPDLTALTGSGSSQGAAASGDIDIAKLMQLSQVMKSASANDKNIDLLLALRPLLKEENRQKIDRLIKIFRLLSVYPALKESGLLGGDLFGIL